MRAAICRIEWKHELQVRRKGTPRTSNDNLLSQSLRRDECGECAENSLPYIWCAQYFTKLQYYISSPFCVCVLFISTWDVSLTEKIKFYAAPHNTPIYIFDWETHVMVLIWRRRDGASALVLQVLGFTHHARSSSQNAREILYSNKANGGERVSVVYCICFVGKIASVCLYIRDVV